MVRYQLGISRAWRRVESRAWVRRWPCLLLALAPLAFVSAADGFAEESRISVGPIDAVLTIPPGVDRPPVVLLIAGSGSTDHDGNGPQIRPATLKKLSDQLVARNIATLRYDKCGAGGWKPAFGRPEDFRFKDYVDDAVALGNYLRGGGKFSRMALVGHSEGGLVAILAAQRVSVDRLVLLVTAARRHGDLVKAQLDKKVPPDVYEPIGKAIDAIMAGQIVDPTPPGFSVAPSMQPGMASAFTQDPVDPLKKIVEPTLIIGGGRDPMERAFAMKTPEAAATTRARRTPLATTPADRGLTSPSRR